MIQNGCSFVLFPRLRRGNNTQPNWDIFYILFQRAVFLYYIILLMQYIGEIHTTIFLPRIPPQRKPKQPPSASHSGAELLYPLSKSRFLYYIILLMQYIWEIHTTILLPRIPPQRKTKQPPSAVNTRGQNFYILSQRAVFLYYIILLMQYIGLYCAKLARSEKIIPSLVFAAWTILPLPL